ncbi:type IV secretory system conjugative DNA transfer family protein [Kushneria indalinina]|uniref:Type IV secretion system protein VirD4 n=1 Tax=Kushneria indalinina DSM 14324 TaxID=1122140 RepID=A0A3D9DRP1_9GAMM|nr:type IV secretory system conjugative DNA transfer family protein [Kushneria indalinina]REC93331.1 type IV secretion system protein VirD4 [Kushneria indalinina DSM 14324]
MKAKQVILLGFVFLLMFALCAFLGQIGAGLLLLKLFDLPLSDIRPNTYMQYVMYYGFDSSIKKPLGFATAIAAGLPALAALFVLIGVLPSNAKKMKAIHGEARFTTLSELKKHKLLLDAEGDNKSKREYPPVLLGKYKGKFIADYSQLYTSVAAAPGAGKGVGFVIPNLLMYPHSCVVMDPKKENWSITAGFRSAILKQDCFLFAPDADAASGYCSHRWNPLDYVSEDEIERLASVKRITTILIQAPEGENQSFYLGAQDLVNGLIMFLVETESLERNFKEVLRLMRHEMGLENWIKAAVKQHRSNLSDDTVGLLLGYANNENPKGRDSIKSITLSALSVFDTKTVAEATRYSDFRFEDLRRKRISIYVGVSPPSIGVYQRLLNLFFSQCIVVNTQTLPESATKKDPLPYQCLLMLDEFPALGKVDIIRTSSGYTRGYNMRYALIYQNRSQLEDNALYGREGASSLLETMHNELLLSTDNHQDAKDYSERLGNTTFIEHTRSNSSGKSSSVTRGKQHHSRALMLPQEIINMPDQDAIIFKMGLHPIKAEKIYWYKDKFFKDRGNLPLPKVPKLIKKPEKEQPHATA